MNDKIGSYLKMSALPTKVHALATLHKLENYQQEKIIREELSLMENILVNYMSKDDAVKLTFHLINILRAFEIED